MSIYFDLDGVIRDLVKAIGYNPQTWDDPLPDGRSLYQFFDDNPDALLSAPPTEYYGVIRDREIVIFTCQPERWIKNTLAWITIYLPKATPVIFQKPEDKLKLLNGYLVEDYPNFSDYSKVILIDKPYNSHIENCYARVWTPDGLRDILREVE